MLEDQLNQANDVKNLIQSTQEISKEQNGNGRKSSFSNFSRKRSGTSSSNKSSSSASKFLSNSSINPNTSPNFDQIENICFSFNIGLQISNQQPAQKLVNN